MRAPAPPTRTTGPGSAPTGSAPSPGRTSQPFVGASAAATLLMTGCSDVAQRGFLPTERGTTNHVDTIMDLWIGSWIAALADAEGGMRDGTSNDGVHPTKAGYAVMTSLAVKALSPRG